MERYVKRRKLDAEAAKPSPRLYSDFWTLIVRHLEWPELYALTKVARKPRKAALPVLLKVHAEGLRIHVVWKLLQYDRRVTPYYGPPYHLWHLQGFESLWFATRTHPRLVNNTTLFGLLRSILWKLRKSKELDRQFGQSFLRFARIAGIIKGPSLKEWSRPLSNEERSL